MTLEEIRTKIDQIDPEIRDLLMKRLDLSREVALAKQESGDLTIYRADREQALLDRLGEEIPNDRKPGYLAVVRKIMETSRMYQYGLLFDRIERLFDPLAENMDLLPDGNRIRLRVSRPDRPNAMSSVLSMIGDYGYDMEKMEQIAAEPDSAFGFSDQEKSLHADLSESNSDLAASEEKNTSSDPAGSCQDQTAAEEEKKTVTFELTIRGSLKDRNMQKLMYQLSMECSEFQILEQYRV